MSKTDSHRPFGAQVSDTAVEYHDHTKGFCDLPPLEDWIKNPKAYRHYKGCTWQPANWNTYKGFGRTKGERYWRKADRDRKDSKRAKDDYDY